MTCRATRRERVLVSRARPSALPRDARDLLRRRARARGDPARRRRRRPPARPTSRRSSGCSPTPTRPVAGVVAGQPNFFGLLEPMAEIGRLAHAAGRAVRGGRRAGLARGPRAARRVRRRHRGRRGPAAGHRAAVRRPVPRDPRLDRRARPPDPGPARRDDDRPRRPARLRDDAARARAGHPARQGGQQHLHEPGAAARSRRASTSRRSGRTACATSPPSAPPGPRELEAALAAVGAPRLHPGAVPQRVRGPRPGRARRSIAGCSTAASSPASPSPTS